MFTFFFQISPSFTVTLPDNQLAGASSERQRKRKLNPADVCRGKNHCQIQPKNHPEEGGQRNQIIIIIVVIVVVAVGIIVIIITIAIIVAVVMMMMMNIIIKYIL